MSDHWADVRERQSEHYNTPRDCESALLIALRDGGRLLIDADALLAFQESVQDAMAYWKLHMGYIFAGKEARQRIEKAFAALAERLRGDPNERSRKA